MPEPENLDVTKEDLRPDKGIDWVTREYPHTPKEADWYTAVIIIAGALTVAAIILNNVIFGFLIIVATFALLLFSARTPEPVEVVLTINGVRIGDYFYPYENLESFNIWKYDDPPRLLLKSKKKLAPLISIEIEEVDSDEVGDYLALFLEEDEELHEPLFQKIFERLGF